MSLKEIVEMVAHIVSTIAILVGGVWTYLLFVRGRRDKSQGMVSFDQVTDYALDAEQRFIKVVARCKNTGGVVLHAFWVHASIQEIVDATLKDQREDGECPWRIVDSCDANFTGDDWLLEPGEEGSLSLDFIVPISVRAAQVHVMVYLAEENPGTRHGILGEQYGRDRERDAKVDELLKDFYYWETFRVVTLPTTLPAAASSAPVPSATLVAVTGGASVAGQ